MRSFEGAIHKVVYLDLAVLAAAGTPSSIQMPLEKAGITAGLTSQGVVPPCSILCLPTSNHDGAAVEVLNPDLRLSSS